MVKFLQVIQKHIFAECGGNADSQMSYAKLIDHFLTGLLLTEGNKKLFVHNRIKSPLLRSAEPLWNFWRKE